MDSFGLLKLPDTRVTSKHHYVKDRLIKRPSIRQEEDVVLQKDFEKIIQLQ